MIIINKKPPRKFNYPKGYKQQNNIAVDMVAAAIYHYMQYQKRIKSISLLPVLFELFQDWALKEFGSEAAAEEYLFYNVTIKKGSILQGKEMMIDFMVTPVRTSDA